MFNGYPMTFAVFPFHYLNFGVMDKQIRPCETAREEFSNDFLVCLRGVCVQCPGQRSEAPCQLVLRLKRSCHCPLEHHFTSIMSRLARHNARIRYVRSQVLREVGAKRLPALSVEFSWKIPVQGKTGQLRSKLKLSVFFS